MKKKVLKFIALIIAIALIVGVFWFANALNGNPISKWLAQRAASAYLEEQYPDTDYYIERLGFSCSALHGWCRPRHTGSEEYHLP